MASKIGWEEEERMDDYRKLYEKVEDAVIALNKAKDLKAFLYLDIMQQQHFKNTIDDLESFLSVIEDGSSIE
jgi:adenylate cyclase class IV